MTEMFKTKHGLNPPLMNEIFCRQTKQSNLINDLRVKLPRVRSVMYGSETVRCRGPQLWCTLQVLIRHLTNLIEFKTKIALPKFCTTLRLYVIFLSILICNLK